MNWEVLQSQRTRTVEMLCQNTFLQSCLLPFNKCASLSITIGTERSRWEKETEEESQDVERSWSAPQKEAYFYLCRA
jgi:hypothetical protein